MGPSGTIQSATCGSLGKARGLATLLTGSCETNRGLKALLAASLDTTHAAGDGEALPAALPRVLCTQTAGVAGAPAINRGAGETDLGDASLATSGVVANRCAGVCESPCDDSRQAPLSQPGPAGHNRSPPRPECGGVAGQSVNAARIRSGGSNRGELGADRQECDGVVGALVAAIEGFCILGLEGTCAVEAPR